MTETLHWSEVSIARWRKYGMDRTYVSGPNREKLGYLDHVTGAITVTHPRHRADVERLLEHHQRAVRISPTIPSPPTQRQIKRKQQWQEGVARAARERGTLSESALWAELERSSPFRWQREAVLGDYRPDFLCPAARIDVEIDGSSHRGREAHDTVRDAWFATRGIHTLRYTAEQVERDAGNVVAHINRWCLQLLGGPELPAPVALLPPLPTPTSWRRFTNRLVGRTAPTQPVPQARPYVGERLGKAFICARCRQERPPTSRSRTAAGRCGGCA